MSYCPMQNLYPDSLICHFGYVNFKPNVNPVLAFIKIRTVFIKVLNSTRRKDLSGMKVSPGLCSCLSFKDMNDFFKIYKFNEVNSSFLDTFSSCSCLIKLH